MVNLNIGLLPMKAHYFLFNAGTAPLVPFIPTLARQLGFSSVVVGSLFTVLPIMGMLVKPTMGAVADRFKCRKPLFLAFILLTIVSFFPILYVPPLPDAQLHCHSPSELKICGVADNLISQDANASVFCEMTCDVDVGMAGVMCHAWNWTAMCELGSASSYRTVKFDAEIAPQHTLAVKDCLFARVSRAQMGSSWAPAVCPDRLRVSQCRVACRSGGGRFVAVPEPRVTSHYQFWLFTVLLVLSWVGMAVVVSLADAICFTILGERAGAFGEQRLWGSVGFGLLVVVAGWLVDRWSAGLPAKDYTPVFYLMAVMLSADLIVSSRIQYTEALPAASIARNIGQLFYDVQFIVFLVWLVTVGMCTALIWNFLFWYLEELSENLGHSSTQQWIKTLEGLVMGVQSFGGELPFFFLSGRILKRVGHSNCMSVVLFAFGVRFLLYSLVTDPWWVLPIELLNGLTFGLLYATMASYASQVALPGTEATVQGLAGAVFEGIGVSSGSFVAGLMLDRSSGATVFRVAGLSVLLLCVLHITAQLFLQRRHTLVISQPKDFRGVSSVYASPSEAIHMVDDPSYELLSS